jgi:hypothetical protein
MDALYIRLWHLKLLVRKGLPPPPYFFLPVTFFFVAAFFFTAIMLTSFLTFYAPFLPILSSPSV